MGVFGELLLLAEGAEGMNLPTTPAGSPAGRTLCVVGAYA